MAWTEQTRILKGQPFSFQDRPYLHQIYRERSPETWIVKGRQTELTEMLVNLMVHNAQQHPDTVSLYMSSTWDKTYVFSNLRVNDMALLRSPTWQKFLPLRARLTRQFSMLNGSVGYFRSAFNRYEEARTFPVDFLYLDETQSQELEYLDVAQQAMSHSKHKRLIGVGTGDYEETEWWKRWHLGTQYRWNGKAWEVERDGDPAIHSYHISQVMVPWLTDADIEAAYNRAPSRNVAVMEIEGWWVRGITKPITQGMIRDCTDPALAVVDAGADWRKIRRDGPIFAGLDWGGGQRAHSVLWLDQLVSEDGPIFKTLNVWLIDHPDVERQADRAIELLRAVNPDKTVMDQGGGMRQVQKVEDAHGPERVHKCWFSTNFERPFDLAKLDETNLVKANRTVLLDGVIDLLREPARDPAGTARRQRLPGASPEVMELVAKHFTSITAKQVKMQSGQEYVKYDKEPGDVNDALMARAYSLAAYKVWLSEQGAGSFVVGRMGSR